MISQGCNESISGVVGHRFFLVRSPTLYRVFLTIHTKNLSTIWRIRLGLNTMDLRILLLLAVSWTRGYAQNRTGMAALCETLLGEAA